MQNPLYQKHFLSVADFSKSILEFIIDTGLALKACPQSNLLRDRVIAVCFFEPSTRTRLSFETAILKLGGRVIGFSDASNTSIQKGETLADTARIINNYADALVVRHPKEGAARVISEFSRHPVVNAGDGSNQHPSQTLLDLMSIKETQGTLEGLKVALVGDLKYGRTVHSLVQALSQFNAQFYFSSPSLLAMPDYILEGLDKRGIHYQIVDSIKEVIYELDILYVTRLQKERFDEQEFLKLKDNYVITADTLAGAKKNLRILHPLPRVDEINPSVDNTPYAYYFQQAGNGLFAREAILSLLLNPSFSNQAL